MTILWGNPEKVLETSIRGLSTITYPKITYPSKEETLKELKISLSRMIYYLQPCVPFYATNILSPSNFESMAKSIVNILNVYQEISRQWGYTYLGEGPKLALDEVVYQFNEGLTRGFITQLLAATLTLYKTLYRGATISC